MDALSEKSEDFRKKRDGSRLSGGGGDGATKKESLTDSTTAESRESSFSGSSSSGSNEEAKPKGSSSPPPPLGWPILKAAVSKCAKSDEKDNEQKPHLEDTKFTSIGSKMSG